MRYIYISITNQDFSYKLLSKKLIEKHIKQVHNYLYIDLIQVAFKLIVKLGLNALVLFLVRDARHNSFPATVMGVI